MNEDIIDAVNDKLLAEIHKAKGLIQSAEACIANRKYAQCAERLQCVGVIFTKFELAVFEAAE